MQAVLKVRRGWSIRRTARYFGFHHTAIVRWMKRAPLDGRMVISTTSSRPRRHPHALSEKVVAQIIAQRQKNKRCSEVVREELRRQGVSVSLSSVKRTLRRHKLLKERTKWRQWYLSPRRPKAVVPGDLVQLDTIHMVPKMGKRWYVYTLIDLASRWAYAEVSEQISASRSATFVRGAQGRAPFQFRMLQSDHGSEFSKRFRMLSKTTHRHSRLCRPNDNAHIERFNRTVQEECFSKVPDTPAAYAAALPKYLRYYNAKRLHLSLNFKTPLEVVRSY